ncbi:hypothetical protein EG799_04510 [Aurantiacibacter spongiae]|uniref:Tyr recombinase domain-containing protein n=1 Tax=Aurantiacibacter spongiae TaxID=2488860 RepID=A0A3N5DPC0_9SPHN|nr:hypothetical protein EG799_04510 [Aurantiacibacter spongiae]
MGGSPVSSGVHFVRKSLASGTAWYVYAWRGGPQILRAKGPRKPILTPADWVRVAEARRALEETPRDDVGSVITAFRQSAYWKELAVSTQRTWGQALERVEGKWGKAPLAIFNDARMKAKIVAWRNTMSATPRTADISVSVLSRFLEWATLEGRIILNPAHGIPTLYRAESRAPVVWLPEDIEALKAEAQQALKDAIDLAAMTGLRRADLVALRWHEINDLAIQRTASKRSRRKRYRVTIPRLPELDGLLNDLRQRPRREGVETVLVTSQGKAWTGDGLNSSFHEARKKANGGTGIWHTERDPVTGEERRTQKRLHDLRGTFATKIMTHPTAMLSNREIADLMGWSPEQVDEIRKRYVDDSAIVVSISRRLQGEV